MSASSAISNRVGLVRKGSTAGQLFSLCTLSLVPRPDSLKQKQRGYTAPFQSSPGTAQGAEAHGVYMLKTKKTMLCFKCIALGAAH